MKLKHYGLLNSNDNEPETGFHQHMVWKQQTARSLAHSLIMPSFTSTLCSQPTTFPGEWPSNRMKAFFSFSTAGFRKILGKKIR